MSMTIIESPSISPVADLLGALRELQHNRRGGCSFLGPESRQFIMRGMVVDPGTREGLFEHHWISAFGGAARDEEELVIDLLPGRWEYGGRKMAMPCSSGRFLATWNNESGEYVGVRERSSFNEITCSRTRIGLSPREEEIIYGKAGLGVDGSPKPLSEVARLVSLHPFDFDGPLEALAFYQAAPAMFTEGDGEADPPILPEWVEFCKNRLRYEQGWLKITPGDSGTHC